MKILTLKKFEGPQTIESGSVFWVIFALAMVGLYSVPSLVDEYTTSLMSGVLLSGILALSLSLLWGYAGVLSLGQAIFYGLGGYAYGVAGSNLVNSNGGGATILALLPGVAAPALLALAFGAVLFYARLKGVYIAILLLVASMLLQTFMVQTADPFYTLGNAALGGANGMQGIPSIGFSLGGLNITIDGRTQGFYYLVLTTLMFVYMGLRWLVNSSFGYVLVGCREDVERTELFGYDTRLVQLVVFCLSAAVAAVAGCLNAAWSLYVQPDMFSVESNILIVIWVTVGGRTDLTGALLGAVVLKWLDVYYLNSTNYALLVEGLILVVVMVIAPQGLYVWLHETTRSTAKRIRLTLSAGSARRGAAP